MPGPGVQARTGRSRCGVGAEEMLDGIAADEHHDAVAQAFAQRVAGGLQGLLRGRIAAGAYGHQRQRLGRKAPGLQRIHPRGRVMGRAGDEYAR